MRKHIGGEAGLAVLLVSLVIGCTGCDGQDEEPPLPFSTATWVAYSPTGMDPTAGQDPSPESIREDLRVLGEAGFTGLVTYGCGEAVKGLPAMAREVGFTSVIVGIWAPGDRDEVERACSLAADVDAYCVGNEGYEPGLQGRYSLQDVSDAIALVKEKTGKPATTTEQAADYFVTKELLELGDWVFPNVHPYWHGARDVQGAVKWTQAQYNELRHRAPDRPLLLKEVGFPTAGADDVNEDLQAAYYEQLPEMGLRFVYFEAFDQPWKQVAPVEPYWGLFRADRTPKKAALALSVAD